jgi:hypothetical protein
MGNSNLARLAVIGEYKELYKQSLVIRSQLKLNELEGNFNETYYNLYANYIKLLYVLLESNLYIKGLRNKRITQLSSYDYSFSNENEQLNNDLENLRYATLNAFSDYIFYGNGAIEMNEIYIKSIFPTKYNIANNIIHTYYETQDNTIILFKKDNSLFSGGIIGDVANEIIPLYHGLSQWIDTFNKLNGTLIANYNKDIAKNNKQLLDPSGERDLGDIQKEITNSLEAGIKDISENRYGIFSEDIQIAQHNLYNEHLPDSITKYLDYLYRILDIGILGQEGITRNSDVGSQSKSNIMNYTTEDIKYSDIHEYDQFLNNNLKVYCEYHNIQLIEYKTIINENQDPNLNDIITLLSSGLVNEVGNHVSITAGDLMNLTNIPLANINKEDILRKDNYASSLF